MDPWVGKTWSTVVCVAAVLACGCWSSSYRYGEPGPWDVTTDSGPDAADPDADTTEDPAPDPGDTAEEEPEVDRDHWFIRFGEGTPTGLFSVIETASETIVAAGSTQTGGAGTSPWLVEIDRQGEVLGQYRVLGASAEEGVSLIELTGGDWLLGATITWAGGMDRDIWLARIGPSREIVWQVALGGEFDEKGPAMLEVEFGRIVVAATTESFMGGLDLWIVELDADGGIISQKTIGGPMEETIANGNCIVRGSDGRVYVAAIASPGDGMDRTWIVAMGADGGIDWQRSYARYGALPTTAIVPDPHGLTLAGQAMNTTVGACSAHLIRTDLSGEIQWQRAYSGGGCDGGGAILRRDYTTMLVTGFREYSAVGDYHLDAWTFLVSPDGSIGREMAIWDLRHVLPIDISGIHGSVAVVGVESEGPGAPEVEYGFIARFGFEPAFAVDCPRAYAPDSGSEILDVESAYTAHPATPTTTEVKEVSASLRIADVPHTMLCP